MQRYILKRLLESVVVVWLVLTIVFMLIRISGNPLALLLPPGASEAEWKEMSIKMGLNKPVYEQYVDFMGRAVRGDLGRSIRLQNRPVLGLFFHYFPNTLQLGVAAILIAIAVGTPLGIAAALRVGGWVDRFGKVFAFIGQSMPVFWSALLLILLFSVTLHLLPTSGMGSWKHFVMPAFSLGWYFAAAQARLTRSAMLEVLSSEYIKMARIKGLPESRVVWKHALKNASLPLVTMIATNFVILLAGTVVTETVFAWPGIGRLTVDAIFARDYPVVQGVVLMVAVMFVLANFLVDVLYCYLDPRIRYQ